MSELKPCPCGQPAAVEECPYPTGHDGKIWSVCCIDDQCGWSAIGYGEAGAIAAWNRRAPVPTQYDAEAEVQRLRKALERLEVSANTAAYCYRKHPGNFAVALMELENDAQHARAALTPTGPVGGGG